MKISDYFCGCGGSSTGLVAAGGEVVIAANHWQLAIDSHNSNHPQTKHYCVDLHTAHPSKFPKTDIAWMSIECTTFSPAGGRKRKNANQLHLWEQKAPDPAIERSRLGAWDVVHFAEYHNYPIVIVENVLEFLDWVLFDTWLIAMHKLGYQHQCVYFNSQFSPNPVPQSRDRIYIVFWKKKNRKPNLKFQPLGYCYQCQKEIHCIQNWKNPKRQFGKYKQQYLYTCPKCAKEVIPYRKPAKVAIDWTLPCPRIGDRKKPLCAATLRRIEKGLKRFAAPHLIQNGHWQEDRVYTLEQPSPTCTTRQELSLAVPPFLVHLGYSSAAEHDRAVSVNEPSYTVTTANKLYLAEPFIDTSRNGTLATFLDEPSSTVTTNNHHALVQPFLTAYHGGRDAVQGVEEPCWTIASNNQFSLAQPFISSYYGNGGAASVEDPSPTMRTKQGHCLIQPNWSELVEDCGYRMLKPHEAKLLMGFPTDYVVLGNQEQQFKQCGNAVTPPVAQMLGTAAIKALS